MIKSAVAWLLTGRSEIFIMWSFQKGHVLFYNKYVVTYFASEKLGLPPGEEYFLSL